jgi:hypothetical protein
MLELPDVGEEFSETGRDSIGNMLYRIKQVRVMRASSTEQAFRYSSTVVEVANGAKRTIEDIATIGIPYLRSRWEMSFNIVELLSSLVEILRRAVNTVFLSNAQKSAQKEYCIGIDVLPQTSIYREDPQP